jgi:hypothetical protein
MYFIIEYLFLGSLKKSNIYIFIFSDNASKELPSEKYKRAFCVHSWNRTLTT